MSRRNRLLPQDQAEGGYFQRLEDGADVVQTSFRPQHVEQGGDIERSIYRGDDHVEASGHFLEHAILLRVVNVMGAELLEPPPPCCPGREGVDLAAPLVGELQRHVAESTDADDTDPGACRDVTFDP